MLNIGGGPADAELRPRSIPLLRESLVPVQKLSESLWLEWLRPPQEYFELRPPAAFKEVRQSCASEASPGVWQVKLDGARGAALTFELTEQSGGLAVLHHRSARGHHRRIARPRGPPARRPGADQLAL
jgi:hypothetical protein